MASTLPAMLDLRRCSEARSTFNGSVDLTSCQRLAPPYHARGTAELALSFGRDSQHRPVMTGRLQAAVEAECQRCLQQMTLSVDIPLLLFLVESEALGQRLEDEGEYLVIENEPVRTLSLIEDELLLALPMVPTHRGCKAAETEQREAPEQGPETHRPFAGLSELHDLRKNDEQE